MAYKILDKQIPGRYFADGEIFPSKEAVRDQLIDFHSIDWDCENDIFEMSLRDILEYGEWELEKL